MHRRAYRSIDPAWIVAIVFCLVIASTAAADDWPQWFGPKRDGVWREKGLLDKFPASGPKVLWRAPLGEGYSGPAVAGDRVYVMDRERGKDASGKALPATKGVIPGNERVLCLDGADGHLLWKHEYDCPYKVSYPTGPRTTPLVSDGRVYTLGAMGELLCLEASSGGVRWSKNLAKEYKAPIPVWGWSANMLLDGDLLYSLVGGEGSAIVAFHKDTGKEAWRALKTKEICYSPPMIYEAGGRRQLIVWLSDSINGLDPATGKVFWTVPYPVSAIGPAVNIVTVRRWQDLLMVTSAYEGPMVLKLAADKPAAGVLWSIPEKDALKGGVLNSVMATPLLRDGYAYGVDFNGALRCLDVRNGHYSWESYAAIGGKQSDCGTVFLVQQGEGSRAVLFNDQGDLILANLTPAGYKEISRCHILEPVQEARKRHVVWSHPAFAHRCVFARNNKEMVCVSLAAEQG